MKNQFYNDVKLYRIVVPSGVGAIVLPLSGCSAPAMLIAWGAPAIGGLAGVLAPSPFYR